MGSCPRPGRVHALDAQKQHAPTEAANLDPLPVSQAIEPQSFRVIVKYSKRLCILVRSIYPEALVTSGDARNKLELALERKERVGKRDQRRCIHSKPTLRLPTVKCRSKRRSERVSGDETQTETDMIISVRDRDG